MKSFQIVLNDTLHPITSPLGNTLPLTDALGRLCPDTPRIIHAFMYFPDDPITAWAFIDVMNLMADETTIDETAENYPRVFKWFDKAITDSIRQTQLAALVGSILLAGGVDRRTISFRKACSIVQQKIDDSPRLCGGKMPRDLSNIRNAFKRFDPSIHLILALISLSKEDYEKLEQDEKTLRKFLSTAFYIQALFAARGLIHDWRPWVVSPNLMQSGHQIEIDGLSETALHYAENYKASPDRL